MVVTVLCAGLTVAFFIISNINEAQWKFGEEEAAVEISSKKQLLPHIALLLHFYVCFGDWLKNHAPVSQPISHKQNHCSYAFSRAWRCIIYQLCVLIGSLSVSVCCESPIWVSCTCCLEIRKPNVVAAIKVDVYFFTTLALDFQRAYK